jgi:hypothetical protein
MPVTRYVLNRGMSLDPAEANPPSHENLENGKVPLRVWR